MESLSPGGLSLSGRVILDFLDYLHLVRGLGIVPSAAVPDAREPITLRELVEDYLAFKVMHPGPIFSGEVVGGAEEAADGGDGG